MCIWRNHKCTISAPFLSKFIHIYDFGGGKGALGNFVFGGLNLHNFRPFLVYLFIRIYDFLGAQGYSSPFTQNVEGLSPPAPPPFLSLCNFITLAWVQGSVFHIAAGSHPVQEVWGHKIVCTGVKFKSCFNVVENHTNIFLLLTIRKKFSLTYLRPWRRTVSYSYWRKDQMLNFWLYRGQTDKNGLKMFIK